MRELCMGGEPQLGLKSLHVCAGGVRSQEPATQTLVFRLHELLKYMSRSEIFYQDWGSI